MAWGKCNDRSINRSIVTVIQCLTRKYWLDLAWLDKFNELFCFLFFLLTQLEPNSIAPNRMDSSRTSGNAINIISAKMVSPRRSSAPMVLSSIHWTARLTNVISPSMWTARIVLNCVGISHIFPHSLSLKVLTHFSFLLPLFFYRGAQVDQVLPTQERFLCASRSQHLQHLLQLHRWRCAGDEVHRWTAFRWVLRHLRLARYGQAWGLRWSREWVVFACANILASWTRLTVFVVVSVSFAQRNPRAASPAPRTSPRPMCVVKWSPIPGTRIPQIARSSMSAWTVRIPAIWAASWERSTTMSPRCAMRPRMCPAVRIGTRRPMIRRTKARALKLPSTLLPHPPRARLLPSYHKSRRTEKRKRERDTHDTHVQLTLDRDR